MCSSKNGPMILVALVAHYTQTLMLCVLINMEFSADQYPLFWEFTYPLRWKQASYQTQWMWWWCRHPFDVQVEPTLFLEMSPMWHQFCPIFPQLAHILCTFPVYIEPVAEILIIHSQFCYYVHFVSVNWL